MSEEQVQGETKEQRFQRLATKRTQAALKKIQLLSNLTTSSYAYTPDQAAKVITALREAVNTVEAKFNKIRGTKAPGTTFSL